MHIDELRGELGYGKNSLIMHIDVLRVEPGYGKI